jgi:hypothetical protein
MDPYLQSSLLTLNIEVNSTNQDFFNNKNIQTIQKELINQTKLHTGYIISPQNCSSILAAMQYFYVNHPHYTISENSESNVQNLNNLVVNDLTKQTVSGVKQHLNYLKYISSKKEPLEYGKSTSVKGSNSLEYNSY